MLTTLVETDEDFYPVRDGKPTAETGLHALEMMALWTVLQLHFEARSDVYVWGNNFIYYERGNRSACIAPDVYVVYGVDKAVRDCYKVWEEDGKVPAIVIEVTSKSTRREDRGAKMEKCRVMGVREYFLYDPRGEYLTPALQGYRLDEGKYVSIERDSKGRLFSESLDLNVYLDVLGLICMSDPRTGQRLLRREELDKQKDAEIERLKQELKRSKSHKELF